MLLAARCPGCDAVGAAPCHRCLASLRAAPALAPPAEVDACLAVLAYEGTGRHVVARLKYRNNRSAVGWLAGHMARLVTAAIAATPSRPACGLVITWVPAAPEHRRSRGFDHAEILARAVARRLRVPCRSILVRKAGQPQTTKALADRKLGPILALTPRARVPATVVVVDDVVTSGASARAAARVLRGAGAASVTVVAAARTPRPGERLAAFEPRATVSGPGRLRAG